MRHNIRFNVDINIDDDEDISVDITMDDPYDDLLDSPAEGTDESADRYLKRAMADIEALNDKYLETLKKNKAAHDILNSYGGEFESLFLDYSDMGISNAKSSWRV